MKTIGKILLFILIWGLIAAGIVTGAILLGYTGETGLLTALAVFVLWALFVTIKKLVIRIRAKKRVKALVSEEEDTDPDKTGAAKKIKEIFTPAKKTDISKKFKSFVRLLEKSRLRKKGHPLYVLPWYILLGEEDAGKRSVLAHAGLPAPVFRHKTEGQKEGVFFEPYNQGVIIHTPGNFLSPDDRSAKKDWSSIISLLSGYRPKEPVNGIILALSADSLQEKDKNTLFEEGKMVRSRLDEMMEKLRISVPVYLLLTKCDLVDGFTLWCERLPDRSLDQAMGVAREKPNEPVSAFLSGAIEKLTERIKDLFLAETQVDYRLLSLPASLEKLGDKINAFSSGAFSPNPYQESPNLRGIYCSSALGQNSRGLFLRDFFTRVIPGDRAMVSTLSRAERAGLWTRRFVTGVWGIGVVILLLVFFWIYQMHYGYLTYMTERYEQSAGDFDYEKIESFSRFQNMVVDIEEEVDPLWKLWFWEMGNPVFIGNLKSIYSNRFEKHILSSVYKNFEKAIEKQKQKARPLPRETARTVFAIINRINFLNAYLDGASENTLLAMPHPFSPASLYFPEDTTPEAVDRMNRLYTRYLFWKNDKDRAKNELSHLKDLLTSQLKALNSDLWWIIPLANQEVGTVEGTNLTYYWTGSGSVSGVSVVPSAYTVSGKSFVDEYITRLMETDPDSSVLLEMKTNFYKRYKKDYLDAWKKFALSFNLGADTLKTREQWMQMVELTASTYNPYFSAIDFICEQLAPYSKEDDLPGWAKNMYLFQDIETYEPSPKISPPLDRKVKGLAQRVLSRLGAVGRFFRIVRQEQENIDRLGPGPDEPLAASGEIMEEAGRVLGKYKKSLRDIAYHIHNQKISYQSMAAYFTGEIKDDPGQNPLTRAVTSIQEMEKLIGKPKPDNAAFWSLYAGPMDIIRFCLLHETACYLNTKWTEDVLIPVEGIPDYKLQENLFGQNGHVWQYLEKTASPFIRPKPNKGYVPKIKNHYVMPFSRDFVNFASRNRDLTQTLPDSVSVKITAFPTYANKDADVQPSMTLLKLMCGDRAEVLRNYNFRISKDFEWNPGCGDILFSITIGGLTLEKVYAGPNAFPNFLKEFQYGVRVFKQEDFADQEEKMEKLGITRIDVQYEIEGHLPLTRSLKATTLPVPEKVAMCWQNSSVEKDQAPPEIQTMEENDEIPDIPDLSNTLPSETPTYSAQVSSFRKKSRAKDHAGLLREKGYHPRVFWLTDREDRIWYTVHIGTGKSRQTAEEEVSLYNERENASIRVAEFDIPLMETREVQMPGDDQQAGEDY